MIIILPRSKFLIIYFVGFISCTTIEITIYPKVIRTGDSLTVECKIINSRMFNNFKTQLRCPFYGPEIICITNCDSECVDPFCKLGEVANQSFICTPSETFTSLTYSYSFPSLSNSVIKNRTQLHFTCSFRGNSTTSFVEVINSKNIHPNPDKPQIITSPSITTSSMRTVNFLPSGSLQLRHMILIGIIGALFISFCVNIWCSVQWCINKSKQRNIKKQMKINCSAFHYNVRDDQSGSNYNDSSSHYCSPDIGKSSRSKLTLHNDPKRSLLKLETNTNHLQTDSLNTDTKNRYSVQSFNEYDTNNESEVNLISGAYGPILLAPFHYVNRSTLPYLYPNNNYHLMQISQDNSKSHSESDILKEENQVNSEIPGRPSSSSGFKKQDEMMSDKDSVFNQI